MNKPDNTVMVCHNVDTGVEAECAVFSHLRLGLSDVLLVEEELTVQVAHINSIEINLKKKET